MKVSCILCHHKGEELIKNSIESLLSQKNVEVEIIVASSVPGANFEGTRTIYVEGGPAHKRNVAFRFAQHNLVAFFDDDIRAYPTAVYEMAKVLEERPDVGMVFGKLLKMDNIKRLDEAGSFLTPSGFLWARAESNKIDTGEFNEIEPILSGKSASCMIKRRVFIESGMFDMTYEILGEETDLSWRVWLCGYKVLFVPKSITLHAFDTKFKPKDFYVPKRVYFNGCRNYLTMLYTNLGKKRWIFPIMIQLMVWSLSALGMFLTGRREASVYILKGMFYFFRNIKTIWKKRKLIQWKIRKISDKELMPIILKNVGFRYYLVRFYRYIKLGLHG